MCGPTAERPVAERVELLVPAQGALVLLLGSDLFDLGQLVRTDDVGARHRGDVTRLPMTGRTDLHV